MPSKRPIGIWIMMILAIPLLLILILGQMMAFIDYGFTVSLGLQEPAEMVTLIGVALNKGFGVADTVVYIPLLVAGLIGLWLRRGWGRLAMVGALAITAYWPAVCFSMLLFARGAPGFNFTRFTLYGAIMSLVFIYAIWGLWYLFARVGRRGNPNKQG